MKRPIGRTTRMSFYSPGGESPHVLKDTWLEAESFAYPNGGMTRRAYVRISRNSLDPSIELPYGELRVVACGIPDTYSTIPAVARVRGKSVRGYVAVNTESEEFEFKPTRRTK